MEDASLRFYFSFRSPYAWVAAERFEQELGDLGVPVEHVPIFPTPDVFPNDPTRFPAKIAHMAQDVPRLARELGFTVRFPSAVEADWAFAHAAFLGAEQQGAALPFMKALFRKRFCEGRDVGDEGVVAEAAKDANVDPTTVVAAGHDEALRAKVDGNWRDGAERDGIFGVPSFVYQGRLYWGQDRMRFVRSAIERKASAPG